MLGNRSDAILIRAKDVTLIVGMLTVAGALYAFVSKPVEWNQTVKDVAEIKVTVSQHDRQLATINAQYSDIRDELQAINRKLGR